MAPQHLTHDSVSGHQRFEAFAICHDELVELKFVFSKDSLNGPPIQGINYRVVDYREATIGFVSGEYLPQLPKNSATDENRITAFA
jgi:hypothetical protein